MSCYTSSGYILSNGNCIIPGQSVANPLCAHFNTAGQCTQCKPRTFFGPSRICSYVNAQCNTFNVNNGNCLSCWTGYVLSNGNCIAGSIVNPLCLKFNTAGQCT